MQYDPEPLTDDELRELGVFLDRGGKNAFSIDELHGFFAALICSPVVTAPSAWLGVVWGGEGPTWESMREAKRAMELLMRYWNQIADAINKGSFSPEWGSRLSEEGLVVTRAHAWCRGFNQGMRLHGAHWFKDDEKLRELTFPVDAFVVDATHQAIDSKRAEEPILTDEDLGTIAEKIPGMVIELRDYWRARPVAPRPAVSRGVPKAGRNAPCPCGSGKKYKHCCGSRGAVH